MSEIRSGSVRDRSATDRRLAAARAATASGCPGRQRSLLANGKLLAGVDGRNTWVRRCKEVIAEHLVDLGGADNASAAERAIVRRASVVIVELERFEARFALAEAADPADLDQYLRGAAVMRRLLEALGLRRRARDVSAPSVAQYVEHINGTVEEVVP